MDLDDGQVSWDAQAATFDLEPDHGLADPAVRLAWERLLTPLLPAPPARVVDVGCGTGSLAVLCAERGLTVIGVDRSPKMLEQAAAKATRRGVQLELELGDAADPPIPAGSADLVLCRHLLWALPVPGDAVSRWATMLRPRGRPVVIEGAWSTGGGIPADRARELVEAHLDDVSLSSLDDPALWGRAVEDERYLLVGAARS